MTKKRVRLIVVFLTAVCVVYVLITYIINSRKTVYEFMNSFSSLPAQNVSQFIYHENISNNEYIVFYINENDNLACAIIKKGLLNYYILTISSELPPNGNSVDEFMFTAYNKGANWIYWGVVQESGIKRVLINEKEAKLIDTEYNYRLFYFLGSGPPNDGTKKTVLPSHELIW